VSINEKYKHIHVYVILNICMYIRVKICLLLYYCEKVTKMIATPGEPPADPGRNPHLSKNENIKKNQFFIQKIKKN